MTFAKLFSSITESTIWVAPDAHRICWITMLAMADRLGRVWGSVPGLANRARISVDDCRSALTSFLSPDPDSRTKDNEGRRIEEIDGGWRLLNHAKFRAIRDEEAVLEAKRKYINTRRAVDNVDRGRSDVDSCIANAEADTDTEKEEKPARKRAAPKVLKPEGVAEAVWEDWLALRRAKRAPVTPTVVASATGEAKAAGMSLEAFLAVWCARGSQGLSADWLRKDGKPAQPTRPTESWKPDPELTPEQKAEADKVRRAVMAGVRRVA